MGWMMGDLNVQQGDIFSFFEYDYDNVCFNNIYKKEYKEPNRNLEKRQTETFGQNV